MTDDDTDELRAAVERVVGKMVRKSEGRSEERPPLFQQCTRLRAAFDLMVADQDLRPGMLVRLKRQLHVASTVGDSGSDVAWIIFRGIVPTDPFDKLAIEQYLRDSPTAAYLSGFEWMIASFSDDMTFLRFALVPGWAAEPIPDAECPPD